VLGTLFFVCIAFLSGSVPFGLLLTRLFAGRDVRRVGSGNIGAANVARAAGTKVGIAVAALDVLKGMVPVIAAMLAGMSPATLAAVAFAGVLGHDFSIFLGFRGGKGVATSIGVALVLAPVAGIGAGMTWAVLVLTLGYTSLASLAALALLQFYLAMTHQPPVYIVLAFALFALSAIKHWENIVRLAAGTEPRFRERTPGGS